MRNARIDVARDNSATEIDCGQCIAHFAAGITTVRRIAQSQLPVLIAPPTLDYRARQDGTGVTLPAGYCSDTRHVADRCTRRCFGLGGCSGFGFGLAPGRGLATGEGFGGGSRHRGGIGLRWCVRLYWGVGQRRGVGVRWGICLCWGVGGRRGNTIQIDNR